MFNNPNECVPECVPSVSQRGPQGTRERVCPPSPSSSIGGHTHEPSRVSPPPCPGVRPDTPSEHPICGHRWRTLTCAIQGPHQVHPDGRIRHVYVRTAA